MYAICTCPVATVFEEKEEQTQSEKGVVSTISDEALYGSVVKVLAEGAKEQGSPAGASENAKSDKVFILSHYGYSGYVNRDALMFLSEEEVREYYAKNLKMIVVRNADILGVPSVQGVCLISLPTGALVEDLGEREEHKGWSLVRLADGREGYTPTKFLGVKRYDTDYLWMDAEYVQTLQKGASANKKTATGGREDFSLQAVLDAHFDGSEETFREDICRIAMEYMGCQYRWGGRSSYGIDCSGLVSTAYMRCGILIYRDANIVDGYAIKRLDVPMAEEGKVNATQLERCLKKGDALYFPGHIAMYIGDGKYIHSTAKAGSNGVVINSLRPEDPDYRQDLVDILYAVGGVRV